MCWISNNLGHSNVAYDINDFWILCTVEVFGPDEQTMQKLTLHNAV